MIGLAATSVYLYFFGSPSVDDTTVTPPVASILDGPIAFVHHRDIYLIYPYGSNRTQLTGNSGRNKNPSWSPDGAKIAFTSDQAGTWDVYVINSDGSDQINLTTHETADDYPTWSPDGTKIAFVSRRDGNASDQEIYVMNADGTGQTRLTNNPWADLFPAWSPE